MYSACCCIPRCEELAGRAGVLCARHLALVPPGLKLRLKAGKRAQRLEGSLSKYNAEVEAVRSVLVDLWVVAFPVPPGHVDTLPRRLVCTCPLCAQAARVAAHQRQRRRYVHRAARAMVDVDEAA